MDELKARRLRRPLLETIHVQRPRCPYCRGTSLAKYRSVVDDETQIATWWVRCKQCAKRFRVKLF